MKKKDNAIRRTLKRILPPPTSSVMRESNSIMRLQRTTGHKVARVDSAINEVRSLVTAQQTQLDRLARILESAQRENRRLHDELERLSDVSAKNEQHVAAVEGLVRELLEGATLPKQESSDTDTRSV